MLSLERDKKEDNPYHGNIVYKKEIPRKIKKIIAWNIAASVNPLVTLDEPDN